MVGRLGVPLAKDFANELGAEVAEGAPIVASPPAKDHESQITFGAGPAALAGRRPRMCVELEFRKLWIQC